MYPRISHIIVGLGLSLLSYSPKETNGQTTTELHNETLVITVYERLLELYIDGQLQSLTNGDNWELPDYTLLQPTNRLIAMEVANIANPQCGGALASVYDGSLLTNDKWKCAPYDDVGWTNLGFDDSSWLKAVEYGSNGNHSNCNQQLFIGNISSNSKWIWTNDLNDMVIYCRGYHPFCENYSPCLNNGTCLKNDERFCDCLPQFTGTYCETELYSETLLTTANEILEELYIDGQLQSLTNARDWQLPDYTLLEATNQLIALKASNLGTSQCGGALASVYDGCLITDNKWKCTPSEEPNWANLGFDDSSWPNAVEYGSNGNHSNCSVQQFIGNISSDSKWIWTSDLENDRVVYCRGYLLAFVDVIKLSNEKKLFKLLRRRRLFVSTTLPKGIFNLARMRIDYRFVHRGQLCVWH